MKNKRIYTLFLLPNGDEIPLSFRLEKEMDKFINEHPDYVLLKRSNSPLEFENKDRYLNTHDLSRATDLFNQCYGEYGYAN